MAEGRKGRLKIFLGYAAGVGKTYSMLEGARQKKAEGVDVAVALAVTHGRKETEKLLEGLEVLPVAKVSYKGVELTELDLDGTLGRRPGLAVVDELAHTNIPGSRHTKRYVDVQELLEAGIDVYTTLNIQHLESFQDPIEEATGVPIRERVPDGVLDDADEVELIDLAPDDLLDRLRRGEVYVAGQATRASHSFFRKENLQLLRELALRKTAALVDTDRSKAKGSLAAQVAPKLLASIGPSPFSERVIRVTKRLADMLKAEWLVASVETPSMALLSDEQRQNLARHFHLAETLGAKVVTLPGESVGDTVFSYAKAHQVTQIVVGHSLMPWLKRLWYRSPADELVRKGGSIDLYLVSSKGAGPPPAQPLLHETQRKGVIPFWTIASPLAAVSLLTAALMPFSGLLSQVSLAMIYLLSVACSALYFPPVSFFVYLCSAVLILDAAYVTDLGQWLGQGAPLLFSSVAVVIGALVNVLTFWQRRLASVAVKRHQEILRLFELTRDLTAASGPTTMLARLNQHLSAVAGLEAVLYLRKKDEYTKLGTTNSPFDATEHMAARWAVEHQEPAGAGTHTLPSAKGLWLPLTVAKKAIGAVGVYPLGETAIVRWDIVEAFSHVMALTLDRSEV